MQCLSLPSQIALSQSSPGSTGVWVWNKNSQLALLSSSFGVQPGSSLTRSSPKAQLATGMGTLCPSLLPSPFDSRNRNFRWSCGVSGFGAEPGSQRAHKWYKSEARPITIGVPARASPFASSGGSEKPELCSDPVGWIQIQTKPLLLQCLRTVAVETPSSSGLGLFKSRPESLPDARRIHSLLSSKRSRHEENRVNGPKLLPTGPGVRFLTASLDLTKNQVFVTSKLCNCQPKVCFKALKYKGKGTVIKILTGS